MIEKVAFGSAFTDEPAIVFNSNKELVKQASYLQPDIEKFAESIVPDPDSIWILVHAIGAYEAYGSNRNGDGFAESALNHVPEDWTGDPKVDRIIARTWQYGWPTYYNAHIFPNHSNKDHQKRIGTVEYVCWNPEMLRVELVLKISRSRAKEHGAEWAVKRLDSDRLLDVSMGTRVPFDLASTHIDWDKYNAAVATYDPAIHNTKGAAVLAFHRKDPIPGLSITRNDYPDDIKFYMNKVHPDGSKNFVWNTFPRFFDISVVFVGAEKPAKSMHKFASMCKVAGVRCNTCKGKHCVNKIVPPGAYLPDIVGDTKMAKEASVKSAIERKVGRLLKKSEIDKKTDSSFGNASVASIVDREEDLPDEVLDALGSKDMDESLSTPTMLGMKLKPREFQRIVLIRMGKKDLADGLDEEGKVFPSTSSVQPMPMMKHECFNNSLAKLLLPFMAMRSSFGPYLKARVTIIAKKKPKPLEEDDTSSLLDKVSAAYNGYLHSVEDSFEKEASHALYQQLMLRNEVFGTGMVKQSSDIIDEFTLEYMKSHRK